MPSRATTSRPADHLRLVGPPAAVAAGTLTGTRSAAATPKLGAPAGKAVGKAVGDWVWHGLGVGAATASAGFATYAMIFSTGEVVPSGNFNLFARYDRLYQAPSARHGSSPDVETASAPEAASPAPRRIDTARKEMVDYTPTGSLAGGPDLSGADATPGRGRSSAESRPLPNFTLRDVFDGKALVESRSNLSVVKPGSVLAGAGEVLSIEKRGERWVVLTTNGMISGQRR